MEGVSTWCQVEIFRLTSFWSPAFYGCTFCLVAFIDLNLSTSDFCSTKANLAEGDLTWKVIVFVGYSYCWAICNDFVFFTLRVFLTNICHFHCAIMFDLESDVRYFEVTSWSGFLMEGVSTWCQVEIFRLTSFRCPAFYGCAFCLVALVDLDLSSGNLSTAEVDLTESHLTWKIVVLIGHCNSWSFCNDLVVFTFRVFFTNIGHFHCTVCFDLKSDIGHFQVTGWCGFLMEGVSAWCQVQFFRLTSFWSPAFYSLTFCLVAFVDLDLCTGDFCSTKAYLTKGNLTWKVIILIGYCNSWTVCYDLVLFTLSVFLADIGHFHCAIMLDLEGDIGYFEVAGWCGFLMEGVSARCQVDVLRLISFRSPAFDCLAFSFFALINLDFSTSEFSTAEVDLAEGHLTWEIIILVSHCNSWTIGRNGVRFTLSVLLTDIGHFYCSVSFDFKSDVGHFEVTGWSRFLMEGISTRC